MPDRPEHRPALAGRSVIVCEGIRLEPLPEGHLLHVLGPIDSASLVDHLASSGLAASSLRTAGYQQWFVAGDERLASARVAALASALNGRASVCDQSHGRIRIGLSGGHASELLSKGTAVDLDVSAFPERSSAVTLFGHISLQITRTGPDHFELTVLRSFAEDLWDALAHLAGGWPLPA